MPRESRGTVRGRRAAAALAVALLSLGATACSARSFRIWGTPGPWHKTFGTRAGFEADGASGLEDSRAARAAAPRGEASSAAYASFDSCMRERGWKAGFRIWNTQVSPGDLPGREDPARE